MAEGRAKRTSPPGTRHLIAVDVGLRNDRTAIVVARRELREREDGSTNDVLIVVAVRTLAPTLLRRVTPEEVVVAIVETHREYPGAVVADLHYADAIFPKLRDRGIEVREAPSSSSALTRRVQALQARFASRAIELLDYEPLRRELQRAQLALHQGGRMTLRAPERRGEHDDHVSALLLVVDPEFFGVLPFASGDLVVRHSPVRWDPESREIVGGDARYFRNVGGRMVEREPPPGTIDFEHYARRMLANNLSTNAIERWLFERGVFGLPPVEALAALDERELEASEGLNVPIVGNW